jgi:hypothetical protein
MKTYIYLILFRPFLLRMKTIWGKFLFKIKTHIFCSITFIFKNRAVYEIMWKNIVERGRSQMTIWRIRIACWIPETTNTRSEYVILIVVPLQQWLYEHASKLCYIACLLHPPLRFPLREFFIKHTWPGLLWPWRRWGNSPNFLYNRNWSDASL